MKNLGHQAGRAIFLAACAMMMNRSHAAVTAAEALVADDFGSNRRGWQAGDGIGSWTRIPTNGSMKAAIVSTTPVVPGGGNYVSAYNRNRLVEEVDTPPAAGGFGLRKQINESVLNTTQPYTISFDFRLDSSLATFTEFNDRIHIAASPTSLNGTALGNTWSVGVVGGGSGYAAGQWYFYNQTTSSGSSFSAANLHMTGVALVTGVTYSFTIVVDPATASYSAAITSSEGSDSASGLTFRSQEANSASSYLLFGGNTSADGESLAFSYDNLFAVPEPSTVLLASGMAGLLVLCRRRAA